VPGQAVCNSANRKRYGVSRRLSVGWVVACLLALVLWATPVAARVLYVNASAKTSTAVNGTSWGRAFRDLQDALALAQPGDEIWIAAGTYRPDRGTGDRNMSFTVEGGVALYGGFAGREAAREQRNWVRNETVLSGDLNGDDGPRDCADVSDCCVVHNGYSCDDGECQLRVCSIDQECCKEVIGLTDGWDRKCTDLAKVECCHLGSWNSCDNSAVVVHVPDGYEAAVIDGVRVSGAYDANTIGERDALSAGIDLGAASLSLANCTISGNARYGLNSLATASKRTVTIESCRFLNNFEASGLRLDSQRATVSVSVFEGNCIGMRARGARVSTCVFSDNSQGLSLGGTGNVVEDSWFVGNGGGLSASALGGFSIISRCYFIENEATGLAVASSIVSDCVFLNNGNSALVGGDLGTTDVRRCVIIGTGKGTERGGTAGVLVELGGLILRDSLVVGNWTWGEGAVSVDALSSAVIRNTVVADNRVSARGGAGIWVRSSDASVENSIVWGNSDRDGIAEDTQVRGDSDSTINVNNSILQDWSGVLGGVGNSGDDPLFVDPLGPDGLLGTGDEDYRVLPDSPAIDAGDPSFVPFPGQTDLDGFPRVLCGRVDIGAYEFGIGDSNCDHTIDRSDFSAWESCMTGPFETGDGPWTRRYSPGCESFDSEYDGDVDLRDYAGLQTVLAGL